MVKHTSETPGDPRLLRPALLTTPWLLPPVPGAPVLQRFAVNDTGQPDFYRHASGGLLLDHEGLDLGGPYGAPVLAAADGVVEYVRYPGRGGVISTHPYGVHVIIRHTTPDGTWRTQYCHLSAPEYGLRGGLPISRGEVLGAMGNSGNVVRSNPEDPHSGTHLHLMVRLQGATGRGETWYQTPDHGVVKFPNDLVDPYPLILWPAAAEVTQEVLLSPLNS